LRADGRSRGGSGVPGHGGLQEPAASPDSLKAIYFDYDRFEIRDDAKPTLKANAEVITSNDGWGRVTIEGHCDERGSAEYNLALGERRANQVRRYLIDLGVPSSRLSTVSFGEANPAVSGHDEGAWRYNRRSEFSVTSR
jgi:peptidoglycan-associated lipoprotein